MIMVLPNREEDLRHQLELLLLGRSLSDQSTQVWTTSAELARRHGVLGYLLNRGERAESARDLRCSNLRESGPGPCS